jgi:hypothetical protein
VEILSFIGGGGLCLVDRKRAGRTHV